MLIRFGPGDFSRVHLTGKYAVGHQKFYTTKNGNPVGVFFPVDKAQEQKIIKMKGAEAYKVHFDLLDTEELMKQIIEVIFFMAGDKIGSTKLFQYLKKPRNKALEMAEIADDFTSGG